MAGYWWASEREESCDGQVNYLEVKSGRRLIDWVWVEKGLLDNYLRCRQPSESILSINKMIQHQLHSYSWLVQHHYLLQTDIHHFQRVPLDFKIPLLKTSANQVVNQVLRHLICNLVDKTWHQLRYQKLAANTSPFLLASHCL